jgi:hypothetical protein
MRYRVVISGGSVNGKNVAQVGRLDEEHAESRRVPSACRKPIPEFVWRKGERWRREYRFPPARTPEDRRAFKELKFPTAGPNAAAWWEETTKGWNVSPMEICDGTAVYSNTSKSEKAEWKKVRSGAWLNPILRYLPESGIPPSYVERSS